MDKRIGFITEDNCPSRFKDFKGYFVNLNNPNNPNNPYSPNYPRAEGRVPGYQNPLLGDPGRGEIARWYTVKTNILYSIVDQIIAQYVRDRNWYSTVRCREALWNMYRRIEWWVYQNTEPGDSEYQRALAFIKDCITQILDTGETSKIIYKHKFKDGLDNSFIYSGMWEIDQYGYLSGAYIFGETVEIGDETEIWSITKTITYPSDGLITFNYAVAGHVERFDLEMDGEVIWRHDSTELVDYTGFTFRDITLKVPKGVHEFKWNLIGEMGGSVVKIDEIIFTELYPERDKPEEVPKCPLPYNHHFASDYMNHFDGVSYERPTFSTVGGSKISDYLDMIRYVSSKENIEWQLVNSIDGSEGNEYIFKLPLERLPETLSSKMTFNWRIKKKGYVTFKYWVDGGNGSELLFYINNQLVGGPWTDTDGWQEARFNLSQSQTYKFDILVHKSVSKDLGTNAVYIKDIQVVEVTDYNAPPMPGDYSYDGEEAEAEYGKWLIYSHEGVLGTYYRGFPDGEEDMTREVEFEFYSECDGVFSFGYRLGTKEPDRETVEGIIFTEQHDLDERTVIWDGSLNGVGIPTISITPKYNDWKNTIPDDYSDLRENIIWTKDSDSIIYSVKIDGKWDGYKYLEAFGTLGILCPPKYVIETDFIENNESGTWHTAGGWSSEGKVATFQGEDDRSNYGHAIFRPHGDTSIVTIEIEEQLRNRDVLNIYSNGKLYRRLYPGFENIVINIPNYGGDLEFEVEEKPDDGESEIVFSGIVSFDGEYIPIEKETMFDNAGNEIDVEYSEEDGRGRRIIAYLEKGSLETSTSWYTNDAFYMTSDLLPGDELTVRIPNAKIPFVDYAKLESMIEEYKAGLDPVEPTILFYEDFNPYTNRDRFSYNEADWQVVNVFTFLNVTGTGDEVLAHDAIEGVARTVEFEINLDGIEFMNGGNYLKFEYGALFNEGDYVSVIARTSTGDQLLRILTQNSLRPDGIIVQGIPIPEDTTSLVFSYTYGGGEGFE